MPPKANKRKSDRTKTTTLSKWYPTEDEPKTGVSRPFKAAPLRKNIAPGQVLILLVGRYKGKRVVFLKQLQSGLLLISGPHKINGVPLRRVNQSTVIPTSHKVDLAGVNVKDINDDYFARTKVRNSKKSEEAFFAQDGQGLTEDEKKRISEKKKTQATIDTSLLANVKKVELLREYLRTRFTVTSRMRVHELIF
jgi:large subunit ribosomal protein L6e